MELIARGGNTKVKVFRWIARVLFLILFSIVLFIWVSSIFNEDPHSSPDPGIGIFMFFYSITTTAMIVAWKYEKLGGMIALAGCFGMSFAIFITAGNNQILAGTMIPSPFYLSSIFFIIAGILAEKN
jgi:ABC-type enterochelin transport system permease subunit